MTPAGAVRFLRSKPLVRVAFRRRAGITSRMNAATTTFDIPLDFAQLTERCMRHLFERLEAILDACKSLDNPKNVNATLRAVSLLLRLCTTVRNRPAAPPPPHQEWATQEHAPAPVANPTHDDPAALFATPATPTNNETTALAEPASVPDWPILESPIPESVIPESANAALVPLDNSALNPRPSGLLASRAGLVLGPGP